MIIQTSIACCGFLLPNDRDNWTCLIQKPFRPSSLWLWGSGVLHAIRMGQRNQLMQPIPFEVFARPFLSLDSARLLLSDNAPLAFLVNAPCHRALLVTPSLIFETMGVGESLTLVWTGKADGILLVGEQID